MKWKNDKSYINFSIAGKNLSTNERNILFQEYKTCLQSIESQKDIFVKISSLMIAVSPFITVFFNIKEIEITKFSILLFSLSIVWFIFFFLIKYLSQQNIKIFYDSLKVIIIRQMLGVDIKKYLNPIIPYNRIEGAYDPFDLKSFPGWFKIQVLPSLFISFIGSIFVWQIVKNQEIYSYESLLWGAPIIFFLSFLLIIRCSFLIHYENLSMVFGKYFFEKLFRIKLKNNFMKPLYYAILNINEAKRLKVDIDKFKNILIHIEDKNFRTHKGIYFKAILRALKDQFLNKKNKLGGSTITQQLVRTLFVIEYRKKFRRKYVELFLSRFWIEKIYNKDEILDLYLCSVRYENKIFGIVEAIKYFFPNKFQNQTYEISPSEAFFLIERVANLYSSILLGRILLLIESCKKAGLISNEDIYEIKELYISMKKKNKVSCSDDILKRLDNKIKNRYPDSQNKNY